MPKVFHLIHLKMLVVMRDFHRQSWSCRVVSCRVVSCRVVSCRVVSCRVVSCRVVSCRVVCIKFILSKVIIQSIVSILSKIFLLYKQSFSSEMICFYG